MAQPFDKRFCGVSSQSPKVSDWVQDHAKRTMVRYWAVGEHMEKNTNIKVHLPLQRLNRFVNGFVERFHGVGM